MGINYNVLGDYFRLFNKNLKYIADSLNECNSKETIIFIDFLNQLQTERRFFCQHEFFEILKNHFSFFTVKLNTDNLLYRARRVNEAELEEINSRIDISCDTIEQFYGFSKQDSFIPPAHLATQGRANSSVIPCLYASDSEITAVSEMRPYKGSNVSVAEIKLKRPLKLFNFYLPDIWSKVTLPDYFEKIPNWYKYIANLYSKPYETSFNNEYLITQCISEFIKLSEAFDGLLYESSLNDNGKNYAIFGCSYDDYSICEPISSKLYSITKIGVEYSKI